jgi:D-alanine-D-alanine ligase
MTKRVLAYHGLPTPAFQSFDSPNAPLDPALTFPLFVKPSREGTGMGVMVDSIVHNEAMLRAKLEQVISRYRQPALVERFIAGREVTVGLVGNLPTHGKGGMGEKLHIFPVLEVDMTSYPTEEGGIYSSRLKVDLADTFYNICPAPLTDDQVAELKRLTLETFRVIGCHDVARVDFRLDATQNEQPYILEINPLPGLTPGYSDLCLEAEADGWQYEALINRILREAAARFGLP